MTLRVVSLIRPSRSKQHGAGGNRSWLSTCRRVIKPWLLKIKHGKRCNTFAKLDVLDGSCQGVSGLGCLGYWALPVGEGFRCLRILGLGSSSCGWTDQIPRIYRVIRRGLSATPTTTAFRHLGSLGENFLVNNCDMYDSF